MSEDSATQQDLPEQQALFQVRHQNQTKNVVLTYKNKEWLDVIRTAIANNRDSDDDEQESKQNTTATNKKVAALASSESTEKPAPPVDGKQNFSGVSFNEAQRLVRQTFSIKDSLLIKFFNPETKLEVRTRQQFVSALEAWRENSPKRWQLYHKTLTRDILVQLTGYCRSQTSTTSTTAAIAATGLDEENPIISTDATDTTDTNKSDKPISPFTTQVVPVESHGKVNEALSTLEHCMHIMNNAKFNGQQPFMNHTEWHTFLRRCWHQLLRICRSLHYMVATHAAHLLSNFQEFVSFGEENRLQPGGHVAQGTAFLYVLVNHGNSTFAQTNPKQLKGCLRGLVQTNFHDSEDFFQRPRPHGVHAVTGPLIALLGTSISGAAAALLASCLRLAKPTELSGVIDTMINRPEIEIYMLGLKLIMTMSTSKEGQKKLWSLVHLYDRAAEIGEQLLKLVVGSTDIFQSRKKKKKGNQPKQPKPCRSDPGKHVRTLRLVAQALLTHLISAPVNGPVLIDNDMRRNSYKQSLPLLLKLVWALDNQTASYACGALATLAHANLLHHTAGEEILQLIELPAALGVTRQAAVTLCNIAHWNPSQNEHDTLLFLSRCARTLAARARNHCESHVQKYIARTMLYVSTNYKRKNTVSHSSGGTEQRGLHNAAKALLLPLRKKELFYGYPGATEDVIRCLWNIGTKDPALLEALIASDARSIMLKICERSIPKVDKSCRRKRNRRQRSSTNRSAGHPQQDQPKPTQDERFLISSLGVLFLLSTSGKDAIKKSIEQLDWLLSLIFQLLNVDGQPRTILFTLTHNVLHASKTSAKYARVFTEWRSNTKLIDHFIECTLNQHNNTFTRLQALAILDLLDVPATTSTATGITYGHTMVDMLKSQDVVACGNAAALLSRWALLPGLKQFLLQLNAGKYAVKVILKTTQLLNDGPQRETNFNNDVLSTLVTAVRAVRNLAVHLSFQESIGKHGITALSHAFTILQEYNLKYAMADAQTALYSLGRNPKNIRQSYKVHLQMQSERLKFEEEQSVRVTLANKAKRSASIRRRIIQSGATKTSSSSTILHLKTKTKTKMNTVRPKSAGLWERKRREMSLQHWISSPLSAKHVISKDDDLMVKKIVPLSTRLCRPNAILLSAVNNPENATFRYQDHWRPNIQSIKYIPTIKRKQTTFETKKDKLLTMEIQERLSKAVMDAEQYTRPLIPNSKTKRPSTAPSGKRKPRTKKRRNKRNNRNRPKTAPRTTNSSKIKTSTSTPNRKNHTRSVSISGDELQSSPSGAKNRSNSGSNRPISAPLGRQKLRNKTKNKNRPATANLHKRTTSESSNKIYKQLQFALKLDNSSCVRFMNRQKQNSADLDTKSSSDDFKDDYDGVECYRFNALPNTTISADLDIPTYELPDGRLTHYYVKTDLQPAGEGIPGSPACTVLLNSQVFPGIHLSTELAPVEIVLDPDLSALRHLDSVARLRTSNVPNTSSTTDSDSKLNHHSMKQHAGNNILATTKDSHVPKSILFDILLKRVGKKMESYEPPLAPVPDWCIYESMYNYRVQDPMSFSTGNDALSSELVTAADWDLVTALHPEVFFLLNDTVPGTTTAKTMKKIQNTIIRHSQSILEAYLIFRSGCNSMFGNDKPTENLFRKVCARVDVSRHCFLAGVIQTASSMASHTKDIASCVETQIIALEKTVATVATHNHIGFRWNCFYNQETMNSIEKHKRQLHIFFMFFADEDGTEITLEQWISFVCILQIELSVFQLSLLFKWSCTLGQTTLKFPGFIEAICRLLRRTPLPTKEECKDVRGSAFVHLENLRKRGEMREWEKARTVSWETEPTVSIVDALPMLVDFIDQKLRAARNIQNFLNKRWTKWKTTCT